MKILHYALGFPPYRRGGLTKYCIDLMCEQKNTGNQVGMLWPGELGIIRNISPCIKRHSNYVINRTELGNYELKGALPVPLLEGVCNPNVYIEEKDTREFLKFIQWYRPDTIHFHTLMGFPSNYLELLNKLNIKTVFTTHDYFGICPTANLFINGENCEDDKMCKECAVCNKKAMSIKKIKVLQSKLYREFKNTYFVRILRKKHWKAAEKNEDQFGPTTLISNDIAQQYMRLRSYYIHMLQSFDIVHFNSSNTRLVYEKYVEVKTGYTLTISNSDIADHQTIKKPNETVQLAYLGPGTHHKGYFLLKSVCDELWKEGYRFNLHIYFNEKSNSPYIVAHAPYKYNEIADVMNRTDCVIVPSIWNETYGFVTLEALSYGVPVLVSSHVGAKDLIEDGKNGFIVKPDFNSFTEKIMEILHNPNVLSEMNRYIVEYQKIKTMQEHTNEILSLYKSL